MNNPKKNKEIVITLDGKSFTVPPGGSLGVLALGNVGIRAWKKAKAQWEKEQADANQ
jgi:hypothetical protein